MDARVTIAVHPNKLSAIGKSNNENASVGITRDAMSHEKQSDEEWDRFDD